MTTGSKVTDTRHTMQRRLDHSDIQNPPGSYFQYLNVVTDIGLYSVKTWSGGDADPISRTTPGKKRFYTTIVNGKRVTRSFREKPLKRVSKRTPHNYVMESVIDYRPAMALDQRDWYDGNDNYVYQDLYSGASVANGSVYTNWPVVTVPTFDANDDINLVNKLSDRIKGSDFNLAVFLGESHQTLRMIGDSAIKLATAYSAARKGNWVRASKILFAGATERRYAPKNPRGSKRSKFGSNWLELQYGWLPLLSDMKSGAELLSHQLHVPFAQKYSVRQSVKDVPDSNVDDPYAHRFEVFWFRTRYASSSRVLIGYISEPLSVPVLSGLLDPELVAWELTPFSFVIDWALPIGNYLTARAFAGHLTGTFVTSTLTRQVVRDARGHTGNGWISPGNSLNSSVDDAGAFYQRTTLNRSVTNSLSVPMPKVKPFNKAASWQHCANGLALLTQVLEKHRGSP